MMRKLLGLLGTISLLGIAAWLAIATMSPQSTHAFSSGITGRSTTGCGGCHGASANTGVTVAFSGPISVAPGSTNNYTVSVSGGPPNGGGLDASVSGGTLAAGANTHLMGTEIAHMDANTRTWMFSWTAPATTGVVTMSAAGNAVDLNGSTSSDAWNVATLDITVDAASPTPPNTPVLPTNTPAPPTAANMPVPQTPTNTPAPGTSRGQQLYNQYCTSCHEPSSPGFVQEKVYGESASDIAEATQEERQMQWLKGILSSQNIRDIASYLKTIHQDKDHDDDDDKVDEEEEEKEEDD